MRRSDREITDEERIDAIIRECDTCRIGINAEGGAYIVPLSFGFLHEGERTFYFHCAKSGRKLDLIGPGITVGFELDCNHALNNGATACDYSYRFRSIIGTGFIAPVEDLSEKRAALGLLMEQYDSSVKHEFSDKEAGTVAVLRLTVREISCKEHL